MKLRSKPMANKGDFNQRLVAILSIIAFFSLVTFLSIKKTEGHCLNSLLISRVTFTHFDKQVHIPNCTIRQARVSLDYIQFETFQKIQNAIYLTDQIFSTLKKGSLNPSIQLVISPNAELTIDSYRLLSPLNILDTPQMLTELLLTTWILTEHQKVNSEDKFEKLLLSETMAHLFLSALDYGLYQNRFPKLISSLIKPAQNAYICKGKGLSQVVNKLCNLKSDFTQDQLEKIAVQDYLIAQLTKRVNLLNPLLRYQLLSSIAADWDRFEIPSSKFEKWTDNQPLTEIQKKFFIKLEKQVSGILGSTWSNQSPVSAISEESDTLFYIRASEKEWPDWGQIKLKTNTFVNFLNWKHVFLGEQGFTIEEAITKVRQAVFIQCYPPLVTEMLKLPSSIEKVIILKDCSDNNFSLVSDIMNEGVIKYLRSRSEIAFYQIHLPSLRWLNEKDNTNPFILIELGNFDHPIFKSMGWESPVYDTESKSFLVQSAIEAIQSFRTVQEN